MKILFLLVIKFYQAFFPKRFRGKCLFKESCSNYVYRSTKINGFSAGLNALLYRFQYCKPNYVITRNQGRIILITTQHKIIEEEYLNENIINEYYGTNK